MFTKVKNKVYYQASTRDYKVGDIIEFGKERNYQAHRVYHTNYKMEGAECDMAEMLLEDRLKHNKKLTKKEMERVCRILWDYGFSMRELGYEICRQKYYSDRPSRLTAMFLCDNKEDAKGYLSTAQCKGKSTDPKVVGLKLNGKLLRTSNAFNMRGGKSIDEFIEQAHDYWKGVGKDYEDLKSIEYLFEGTAEVVEIIRY